MAPLNRLLYGVPFPRYMWDRIKMQSKTDRFYVIHMKITLNGAHPLETQPNDNFQN